MLEIDNVAIVMLVSIGVLNVYASILVFARRIGNTGAQKLLQLLVIWCLPLLGVILVLAFRYAAGQTKAPAEEERIARHWAETNEETGKDWW